MKGYRIADGIDIYPEGAALLTDQNALVVADLHLGCEAAFEENGISIPRVQTRKIESQLVGLIERVMPSTLIVAGDLKHNFSRNLAQEWQDVTEFVKRLGSMTKLKVVKGNHDNFLGQILREVGVPLRKEVHIGDARVLHGHEGIPTNEATIFGHIHPSISLKDDVGALVKGPCFLYSEEHKALILPAQSIVFPGTDVVGQVSSDTMSPLLPRSGLSGFVPVAFSGRKALKFPPVALLRRVRART